ncbi:MAG: hypothetical protein KC561_00415 [Myxococcales bacterium]|nr:hypothetical protein [Myxococcales bacterium]
MKVTDSNIVASVLDLLANLDETLRQIRDQGPSSLGAVGAEVVDAIEGTAKRLETALANLGETFETEIAGLSARVSETTARVVELNDSATALMRGLTQRVEILENARLNTQDAIRTLEDDVTTLRLALDAQHEE